MTLALSITLNVNSTWVSTSFFLRLFKTYYLPYCNLVQGIYYIYHDWRLDNQWWHRPLKMATTVYEREISFAATQTGELSRRLTEKRTEWCSEGKDGRLYTTRHLRRLRRTENKAQTCYKQYDNLNKSKSHRYTNSRPSQYLTHAHSHITRAVSD